jgi:hypothetical protein
VTTVKRLVLRPGLEIDLSPHDFDQLMENRLDRLDFRIDALRLVPEVRANMLDR